MKSYVWMAIVFIFDGLVYYRTIGKVINPFLDNAISIFFVYMILMLMVLLIMLIILSNCLTKLKSTGIVNKVTENAAKVFLSKRKLFIARAFSLLRFFVHVGFGVIGCWKFFIVGMIYSFLEYLLMMYTKEIKEQVQIIKPEIQKQMEESGKKSVTIRGLKFKFLEKKHNV